MPKTEWIGLAEADALNKKDGERAKDFESIARDLIRATNGAQINPRFPIGAGMAAQIQAVAERARILIEGK